MNNYKNYQMMILRKVILKQNYKQKILGTTNTKEKAPE